MEIPTQIREAIGVNPNIQIIYSLPKAGKTSICSLLEDHLIVELEPGGADYVKGRIVDVSGPKSFYELLESIKASETQVCTYLVIDTVTKLDEWSEIVGTYDYMKKPQGKSFNRMVDTSNPGAIPLKLKHTDKQFETVHEIPNGNGYQYSRNVMTEWYDMLLELIALKKVKYVVLLAHVKDKFLDSKVGDAVMSIELNLTGKVKNIYSSRCDAIAYMFRLGNEAYLSYNNGEKIIAGGRCKHLSGDILICKSTDSNLESYWDKIYINNKKEVKSDKVKTK